jgi:hypothetical protein
MERSVTGKNQFERTNPDFFFVDMRAFAQHVGVENQAWTESLKGQDPKQVLVHMFLAHMDPNNKRDLLVIFPKFTKLCGHFEKYLKNSIYEMFKTFLDDSTNLAAFWDIPEDHTKLKKPDEKIRDLSKFVFHILVQTYIVVNAIDYVRLAESVRLLGFNQVGDSFAVKVGDEAQEFSTKPFVSFIRVFAPLAKNFPQLYGRVYCFKMHPNGTTTFDVGPLENLAKGKTQKEQNLKTFKEALSAYSDMMSAELVVGHFDNVSELSEFSGILSKHIVQYESSAEATNDVTKLRSFVESHPKFLSRYHTAVPGDFLSLLDMEIPKEESKGVGKQKSHALLSGWMNYDQFDSPPPQKKDFHSFFIEEEEET